MISLALAQSLESLLGTLGAARTTAGRPTEFSSVLSEAEGSCADTPPAAPADPAAAVAVLKFPLALPAGWPPATQDADVPAQDKQASAAPALPSPPVDLPIGSVADKQQSSGTATEGKAVTGRSAAEPAAAEAPEVVQINLENCTRMLGRSQLLRPASRAHSSPPPLSKSDVHEEHPNPAADLTTLNLQQVLAAAASLMAPAASSQNQAAAAPPQAHSGLPATTDLATASRQPRPAQQLDTVSLEDTKPSAGELRLSPVESQNLAAMLDAHLATQQVHGAASSAGPGGPAHSPTVSAQAQGIDLHQLDALVRDIAEVSGTNGRAALRLTAEQLGPLEIRLHKSDAGMSVTIRTESEQSHSTVVQAQQQLSDDMRANGLKVAATSVMLGHGGAETGRQDRQSLPFAAPIEAAVIENDQAEPRDEQRPAGRYA